MGGNRENDVSCSLFCFLFRECAPRHARSDHALLHPLLHRHAAVGAYLHLLCASATRALVAAWHGKVRLRMSHTHDARGFAAEAGFGNVVAAGDVADLGERLVVWLRRSRCHLTFSCSRPGCERGCHARRARGCTATHASPATRLARYARPPYRVHRAHCDPVRFHWHCPQQWASEQRNHLAPRRLPC